MSDLVENLEDLFSHVAAHTVLNLIIKGFNLMKFSMKHDLFMTLKLAVPCK